MTMHALDTAHPIPDLAEKLQNILLRRSGPSIEMGLRPGYLELLARLGHPHEKLPPVIHVAGTNGKGSVIATLRALLEAAGYRPHVYTSPHLRRFNERIVLGGQEIDDSLLEELLDDVTAKADDLNLTFFEITTALAFAAFARSPGNILLLETGLGGRLDSTNVIKKPLATIITAISCDHTEFLGDTLPLIASEKAGIMKRGVTCVIGPQTAHAVHAVFSGKAKDISCPLWRAGYEWDFEATDTNMTLHTKDGGKQAFPLPSLKGPHQAGNAATAMAALRFLEGFEIPDSAITPGLQNIRWPARLQKLVNIARESGWEIWLDGGHNEGAAHVLARQAALWQQQDQKPLHLVLGMMQTKSPAAFLKPLAPYLSEVTGVPIRGEAACHTVADITAAAQKEGLTAQTAPGLREALLHKGSQGAGSRLLIAGSLYLAGECLDLEAGSAV